MDSEIVVFGYGAVGKAVTEALVRLGRRVLVAQRSRPADLVAGASFRRADVLDAEAVRGLVARGAQVVMAVGFAYSGRVWKAAWPRAMSNLLAACAATSARLVFADNMYMYGPQSAPLREDMALTDHAVKPAVRTQITRLWQAASDAGRVQVAAVRAPDFYGPRVGLSHLGDLAFGALARGRAVTLIVAPDMPHAFAYVPDIARAVVTLLDAGDDAYGQAWHVPCAALRTPRAILALGAEAIGRKLRIRSLPLRLLPAAGLFSPFLREVAEMRFTFDRPYAVDSRKFEARFWSDATPFAIGAAETAKSFVGVAGRP
jgi:nucleoside-diphosphate-sugar epimerase